MTRDLGRRFGGILLAGLGAGLFYYLLLLLVRPERALIATAGLVIAVVTCRLACGPRTAFAVGATVLGLVMLFSAIVAFTVTTFYRLW